MQNLELNTQTQNIHWQIKAGFKLPKVHLMNLNKREPFFWPLNKERAVKKVMS